MLSTYLLTLLTILLASGYFMVKRKYSFWSRQNVPHLKPRIPYGNFDRNTLKEHPGFLTKQFYNLFKKQGPLCGIYMYHATIAIITDLELIKNILIKDFEYFEDRGLYYNEKDDPLSAHLIALNGEKWRPLRNKLSPIFSSGKMKFMYPTMFSVANQLEPTLSSLIDNNDGGNIEIHDFLSRFLTDIIGTCVFGIECNSLKDPYTEFRHMGKKVMRNSFGMVVSWLLLFSQNFARKLGIRQIDKNASKYFMKIIYDTVALREKNNIRRNDFLDLCIDLKNNTENSLTFNEIAAQAFMFFFAGFETSTTTMTFSFLELARHLDIQEKARDEITKVLLKHNGKMSYDALMEMRYINQIIQETLRLHSPIGNIVRVVTKDYLIPGTNITLYKNQPVFIPTYGIQHDPDYYAEPDVFKPERFEPDEIAKRANCTFLAFGEGHRNCIGQRFAMMQIRIGLVTLLRHFKITNCSKTVKTLKCKPQAFVLSPVDGLWLHLEKVNANTN